MPRSHSSGSPPPSGPAAAQKRSTSVGRVEHQERPALAEARARCAHRVREHPVHAPPGRPARAAYRRTILRRRTTPGTPWRRSCPLCLTSSRCGATSRRSARSATSGGYFRQPFTPAERECQAWFLEEAATARDLDRRAATRRQRGRLVAARPGPLAARRADRLAPRLGPRRRRVRRPARRGLARSRRSTCCASAASCRPSRSASGCSSRRRGPASGSPAWARGWPPERRPGSRPRRCATATGSRSTRGRGRRRPRPGRRPAPAGARRRRLRRAARRAGPRPRRPGRRGRRGQRDLAARPLPLRLHRRGQPRRARRAWRTATTRC